MARVWPGLFSGARTAEIAPILDADEAVSFASRICDEARGVGRTARQAKQASNCPIEEQRSLQKRELLRYVDRC
jgi:hypothetical protein